MLQIYDWFAAAAFALGQSSPVRRQILVDPHHPASDAAFYLRTNLPYNFAFVRRHWDQVYAPPEAAAAFVEADCAAPMSG